jgi:alanine racemase
LILSDILQSGRTEMELYTEVNNIINQNKITRLYGIGEKISEYKSIFKGEVLKTFFYSSTDQFIDELEVEDFKNHIVLVKGARIFEFEKISKLLEQKAHETVLEINLNALSHNLNVYSSMLKPGTKIMTMIKAYAYGGGSFEIARLLQHQKTDYIAVAYIDEGVELRKAGITMPILVLNPEISNFNLLYRYNLEPEIYSIYILKKYLEAIHLIKSEGEIFPIQIKLDTGMHRLGFVAEDIDELLDILREHEYIKVNAVFSHLASADNELYDQYTLAQINLFNQWADKIESHIHYKPWRHILNSSGITRFKEYQMDMVRLGIGFYGIDGTDKIQDMLKNVATLKTTISQIKKIKKGEAIGYNRMCIAPSDMIIATVSIGYADGLNRKLSNGLGEMIVNGLKAPIIGNICMDMTMIDITAIEDVKEGDPVVVFGDHYPVSILAEKLGTISYEVMTGISQRVKRIYFQE